MPQNQPADDGIYKGCFHIRNRYIPIVDSRLLLGKEAADLAGYSGIILLEVRINTLFATVLIGLLVETIHEVETVEIAGAESEVTNLRIVNPERPAAPVTPEGGMRTLLDVDALFQVENLSDPKLIEKIEMQAYDCLGSIM